MTPDFEGMRVETPPESSEKIKKARHLYLPLRIKLMAVFVVALLPLAALQLLDTSAISALFGGYFIPAAVLLCALFAYMVVDRMTVRPLRQLLHWLQTARKNSFEHVPIIPIASSEYGQLARELSASTSFFWESEQRVRTLLAHKSDTLSLIEHQLRTPLTALLWSLEGSEVPSDVQQAIVRISSTVESIVEASRIEEGKFGYVFAKVDLVPLTEKIRVRLKPLAESRNVQLTFTHEPNLPRVRADEDRIGIVMANLLSNAIDYTPSGGSVDVSIVAANQQLDITVHDSGIGIPKGDMPHIFNKLYRGSNAVKMRPDGSGIGLFVAKNILHAHGAEIVVRSGELRGTEVSFSLPVA